MKGAALFERFGVPGIVGAVLLLFAVVFWFGSVAPLRTEAQELRAEQDRLAATTGAADRTHAAAAPARQLPSFAQAPELLKQLNALAEKHGVAVARTSYQVQTQGATRRFEIAMPLKVAYPVLRAYLRDALALSAGASLDDLNLHRAAAGDPAVDADVRLSYSFAAAP